MNEPIAQLDTDELWQRRKWWRRTAAFIPLFVVLGLALPILTYVMTMVNLGWRAPVLGANTALLPAADAPVYLYASPQTARFLRNASGDYELLLKPWRTYFADRRRDYQEINDLAELKGEPGSVLVLPSSLALGDLERNRIAAFQAAGGGILATWATGSRDGAGEWRGWDFLKDLGFYVIGEISAQSQERQLTLIGETPLTASLEPGLRVWMTNTSEPLLRIKGEHVAARFTNWQRTSVEGRGEEGAVLYNERANARVAMFAFSESTWAASPVPNHRLIDDTLAWLQRQPTLILSNWPNGQRAAQAIEMDTEEGFANARAFSSMLLQARLPASFFVLASSAVQYPDVYRELASRHEIAYHGDLHVSFKGQPAPEQERRLAAMRGQLESIGAAASKPILGFRAPTEGYDATTERLLQQMGLRYHVADPNRSENQLPLFVKMDGVPADAELLVIPRTQHDDINLLTEIASNNSARVDASAADALPAENPLVENQLAGNQLAENQPAENQLAENQAAESQFAQDQVVASDALLRMMLTDVDKTLRNGGLGLFSVHSQNFGDGAPLQRAMPAYLSELKARSDSAGLWVASTGEIDTWWRERRRVAVAGVLTGWRVELNITVKGERPVRGVAVTVMLPSRGAQAAARGTKVGTAQPRVVPIDPFRSQFLFDELAPGNYSYQVNFTEPRP